MISFRSILFIFCRSAPFGQRKKDLAPETLGHLLILRVSQAYVPSFIRDFRCPEEVIPQAKRKGKIDPVLFTLWNILNMMPFMELGIVEHVFQRPQRNIDIGMIEVADGQSDEVYEKELPYAEADHGQRDVFDAPIEHGFHPMKPKVRRKPQLFSRVMDFVELPEDRDLMEPTMDIPLDEIPQHEHQDQLSPNRPGLDGDGHQVLDPEATQQVIESFHHNTGDRVVSDQGKDEEIEEHVEGIQPEVSPHDAFSLIPRADHFEDEEKKGDPDQPIEIVVPGRGGDLFDQIAPIIGEGFEKKLFVSGKQHGSFLFRPS